MLVSPSARGPAEKPFACPGLNSDQDMQINFGFFERPNPRRKTLCMSRSDLRPGHANQFWFPRVPGAPAEKPFACPGLNSDQDMQNSQLSQPHFFTMVLNQKTRIWTCRILHHTAFCMSRSDLRPGHAELGSTPDQGIRQQSTRLDTCQEPWSGALARSACPGLRSDLDMQN